MSELVLLVRHRGVDLVAMSARAALRGPCGLGGRLASLRREDAYVLGVPDAPDAAAWEGACTGRADWFNPNKHRYALYEAAPGALAVAAGLQSAWPWPWLTRRLGTDRPDLAGTAVRDELEAWLAVTPAAGTYAVTVAAWQRDQPVHVLPRGHWPAPATGMLRLELWTLSLQAASSSAAQQLGEEAAITRTRAQGLLIHPHMQGWAFLGLPRPLVQEVIR